jgi:hypothetical protein
MKLKDTDGQPHRSESLVVLVGRSSDSEAKTRLAFFGIERASLSAQMERNLLQWRLFQVMVHNLNGLDPDWQTATLLQCTIVSL